MMRNAIIILITFIVGALRIHGLKGDIFKDLAHVWVGILFGGWFVGMAIVAALKSADWEKLINHVDYDKSLGFRDSFIVTVRSVCLLFAPLAWGLTAVEGYCFFSK